MLSIDPVGEIGDSGGETSVCEALLADDGAFPIRCVTLLPVPIDEVGNEARNWIERGFKPHSSDTMLVQSSEKKIEMEMYFLLLILLHAVTLYSFSTSL